MTHTATRRTAKITGNTTATIAITKPAHAIEERIEDTRLFWVFRSGRQMQRTWKELTATEREQQLEAQRRASYVALFDVYVY